MTRDETLKFMERRLEAMKQRDIDALASDHAEDCVFESPLAGTFKGRAGIEKFYRELWSSFPDFAWEATDFIVDGDRVVQISKASGTDKGGFMNLPPTGKRFAFPMVLIYRLKNGLIVHQQSVYDFTGWLMQVGVLKARPL
jgi:steroid delta-isomerase-like uncharacterized protein